MTSILTLNRPNTSFYSSCDVNISAAEMRQTKTRPFSFYMIRDLLYEKVTDANKL